MPTLKAFLSHSHRDAELVHAVAAQIGRPFVNLDFHSFVVGDELLDAMDAAIAESAIFVLFVSRPALESVWVNYEVNQARFQQATRRLERVLTFIVDRSIRSAELPDWLTRTKFQYLHAARPIARIIKGAIDDLVRDHQTPFFVGRSRETTMLQEMLAPANGDSAPRVFAVSGLDGIGRETLLRRVGRDLLNFSRILRIQVEPGDSLQDVAAKLADLTEPVVTPKESERLIGEILGASPREALRRALDDLRTSVEASELPYLYDRGGLLDEDGHIGEPLRPLIDAVRTSPILYLGLVTNRRPLHSHEVGKESVPVVDVRPLSPSDVRRLLGLFARRDGIALTTEQLHRLATDIRGYPPAAIFSFELAKTYGADVVMAQRDRVVAFRVSPLLQYLRSFQPDSDQREILRSLASNSPLPLTVLAEASGKTTEELGSALMTLIDASLVVPTESGWYSIADPIAEAVARECGTASSNDFLRVAAALDDFLQTTSDDGAYLELSRVRFRALYLSGMAEDAAPLNALAADWIQLAERMYHQHDYEAAIRAGRAAVEVRPRTVRARVWLIRALIKTERFDEVREHLRILRQAGAVRDAEFLRGFLERHRGEAKAAIDAYRGALRAGYRGIAIHRELALCYFEVGNYAEARRHIDIAQERQPDNPYVVDLMIKIACAQGDEDTARALLRVLEGVDQPAFVAHRRSRVEDVFGSSEAAYRAAKEAVDLQARPPFEILAQLILCEIKTARHDDAARHLQHLGELYGAQRRDIQTGLRARAAIARGAYEDALGYLERLRNKTKPVHLNLRRDALVGMLRDTYIPEPTRSEHKDEIARLNAELQRVEPAALDPLLGATE